MLQISSSSPLQSKLSKQGNLWTKRSHWGAIQSAPCQGSLYGSPWVHISMSLWQEYIQVHWDNFHSRQYSDQNHTFTHLSILASMSSPHPRLRARVSYSIGWQRVSKQHVTMMMTAPGGGRQTQRDNLGQAYESCAGERNYWGWREQGPPLRIIPPLKEVELCSFCISFAELRLCRLSGLRLFWWKSREEQKQHKTVQQSFVSKTPFISALQVSWSL